MTTYETLRKVPLFADLPEDDLSRLCAASHEEELPPGATLFTEGDRGDAAYVITGGTIEIVKNTGTNEVLLALRHPGEVIGEMALLQDEPRMASARARDHTTMLVIPRPALADLLETSPGAVRALFDILLERLRSTESQLRQNERMAQLGTLTAGVAHELNNPAAAVARAADQLGAAVLAFADAHARVTASMRDEHRSTLEELTSRRAADTEPLGAVARSDLEQQLEDALADAGVAEPWTMAADLVGAGVRPDDLDELRRRYGPDDLAALLSDVGAGRTVESLLHTVSTSAARISAIVKALKSYSFLDQAPVQNLDVTEGIDDTILILGPRLEGITITRDYDPALPCIEAHGSELNQVWTNLLENAADAIAQRRVEEGDDAAGRITVRASAGERALVVDITDDGMGIPADVRDRIFDSFFTTKEPGKGTGLGLDICRRIVVTGHGGDITVDSEPGRTTVTVKLPRARHAS